MIFRHCLKCNQRWELGTASACKCPDETPQRPWVGLTDAERLEALRSVDAATAVNLLMSQYKMPPTFKVYAEAIEAKLKEKNT
jgi:hypothetical protein